MLPCGNRSSRSSTKAINNISQAAAGGQIGAEEKGELGKHLGSRLSTKRLRRESGHAGPTRPFPPPPTAQSVMMFPGNTFISYNKYLAILLSFRTPCLWVRRLYLGAGSLGEYIWAAALSVHRARLRRKQTDSPCLAY